MFPLQFADQISSHSFHKWREQMLKITISNYKQKCYNLESSINLSNSCLNRQKKKQCNRKPLTTF